MAQDESGDFRGSIGTGAQLDAQDFAGLQVFGQAKRKQLEFVLNIFDAAPHQALYGIDGVIGSLDQVLARCVAYDDLIVLIERDH